MHSLVMREISVDHDPGARCGEDLAPALEILADDRPGRRAARVRVGRWRTVPSSSSGWPPGRFEGKVLFDPTRRWSPHMQRDRSINEPTDEGCQSHESSRLPRRTTTSGSRRSPSPPRLGPGEVLLRPCWCGICGTDLHEYAMGPIVIPTEPHPLNGSSCAADPRPRVLGRGARGRPRGHARCASGDRVSVMPLLFCGACYYCRRGLNHLCVSMACVGLSYGWGGIAELASCPSHVSVLPDRCPTSQGALVEPAAVAAYGVDTRRCPPRRHRARHRRRADRRPGGAVRRGARRHGRHLRGQPEARRAGALPRRRRGARPALDRRRRWVKDRTGGIGVDAVIECSGNETRLQTALAAVRAGGPHLADRPAHQAGRDRPDGAVRARHHPARHLVLPGHGLAADHRPRSPAGACDVEKVVSAQIEMADIVEKGFETLLSPTGDQVKVLVDAQLNDRPHHGGGAHEGTAVRRRGRGRRSRSCPSRRSPTTRCSSRRARWGSATPTSTCSRGATSSRSPTRSSPATSGPARWWPWATKVTGFATGRPRRRGVRDR